MKQRISGIDLVKCIAIFFVISVHFFLNTKFYQTPIIGGNMFLQLNMRWLFFTCVPLFLIASGYLQCEKRFDKKYLFSGIKITLAYVLISIISIWYRISSLGQSYSVKSVIKSILDFSGNGYSWYVEMYIGLFFLIPFLNLMIKSLTTKKAKLSFILILIILCSISELGLFLDYWAILMPILYYTIGVYINEFQPKVPKLNSWIMIVSLIVIESTITGIFSNRFNNNLFGSLFDGYGKIFTLVLSVLIFLYIYDIKPKSEKVLLVTQKVSESTLEIYLFSFIFDLYFYQILVNKYFISQQQFLKYYFILVPLVFTFSFISAYLFRKLLKEILSILNNTKRLIGALITTVLQLTIMILYYNSYGKQYFTSQFYVLLVSTIIIISILVIGKNTINEVIVGKRKNNILIIFVLSFYWSFVVFGKSIYNDLNIDFKSIFFFFLLSIVILPVIFGLFNLLDKCKLRFNSDVIVKKNHEAIIFCTLFIILLIISFAFYPGIMTSDGGDQWVQAIGKTPIYDAHTPTHTIMIRLCSYIWKNPYMVVLIQIFTFSLVVEKILSFFINRGLPQKMGYIIAFIIAISPNTNAMISLISKNIAFTIVFLWVLYQLLILLDNKEAFISSNIKIIMFSVSLTLLQLIRKNTFTAVYFIFAFLVIVGIKNYSKLKWRPFVIIFLCIILVKIIEGPVYTYYKVEGHVDISSGIKEPCYMAVGAVLDKQLEIDKSDKVKLSQVLDLNEWKKRYNPYNYDIFSWSEPKPNKGILSNSEVLDISFRLFKKYPMVMIKSRLDATDIIWNIVKPPYVNVGRYSIGLLITESIQKYVPELARDEIYKGGDLYLKENKMTQYMAQYFQKSTEYTLTDMLFWRVGIYFGLSISLLFYSLYIKNVKLLIMSLFGLFMMLSLLIALGWQIYQYVWYYSLFTIMLLLYSLVVDTKEEVK